MNKNQFLLTLAGLVLSFNVFATGAIAVDDEEGDEEPGYGLVTGHADKAAASKAALAECKKAGNNSCKVVVWFDKCGAYAASKKYYGVGWGSTEAAASKMAKDKCGNKACEVKLVECE